MKYSPEETQTILAGAHSEDVSCNKSAKTTFFLSQSQKFIIYTHNYKMRWQITKYKPLAPDLNHAMIAGLIYRT